jgi:hypothetical protein
MASRSCITTTRFTPVELAWKEWLNNTTPHARIQYLNETPFSYEFRRYGQAIALLEPKGDYIFISKLEALQTGQRAAKNLIEFLKKLSDKYDVRLFARAIAYQPDPPVPTGHLLTQTELQDWYAKLGFRVWPINRQSADVGYPDLPHD